MAKTQTASLQTTQSLGALLKSAHDIMRKDKWLTQHRSNHTCCTEVQFEPIVIAA
jgi:hypothetical protein